MMLNISRRLIAEVIDRALATPDVEICGLLLGTGLRVTAAPACRNVAVDPTRRFEIDPAALLAAHRDARRGGPVPIGHYHSHPRGLPVPSACDAASASADGAIWLIVGGGEAQAWRAVAGGAVHGMFDAMALELRHTA